MGYTSTIWGEITIDPPLTWAQAKDHPFRKPDGGDVNWRTALCLVMHEENQETDRGVLHLRQGVGVQYAWERPEKCREVLGELQRIVDLAGPAHTFTGALEGTGSDFGDIWLLRVIDGRAVRWLPTITWPDGTVLVNDRYRDGT
jgi:hypothetical protein